MNKKGFSLMELLAVIIIIGILSTIGIAAVSSYVQDSRRSAFSDLAKMYAEKVSEDRAKDKLPVDVKDKEAILLPIGDYKLDTDDEHETAYGTLDLNRSYVVLTNNGNVYNYYVFMIDDSNHGMVNVEYSEIDKDKVTIEEAELSRILNYRSLNATSVLTVGSNDYKVKQVYSQFVVLKHD